MKQSLCAVIFTTVGLVAAALAADGPAVAVTGGKVEGRLLPEGGGAVFKGLPFAQPPVGDLRWREPQPVKAWTGIRQAAEFGSACPQTDSGWNKLAADRSSEDCLYLNVWTPQWPAKAKRAVMVWIHGGGNNGGSAMGAGGIEPPFDAANLARHGVVVVTINYRLGLFGFMGHPELTAESPHHASGGYGLLDQVAALQWVQANIASFGGDPGNVTLFGQSAGAQDTSILVASRLIVGLVHKAIAQSGTPMIGDKRLQTPAQTEQLGVILAAALHAPATGSEAIPYLRGLTFQQILAATAEFRKNVTEAHLIFDVGMDGYAVPQFSPEVYRSGKEAPLPMIIGSNGRDSTGQRPVAGTEEEIRTAVKNRVETFYASYPDLVSRAQLAYGLSGGEKPAPNYAPHGALDLQFNVDNGFRCEAVALSAWHSQRAPTWQYEFTAGTVAHPPAHSAELDFVFGYLRDQAQDPKLSQLSQQMQTYWTNFAKTGNPNGPGLPQWPKYERGTQSYLEFYTDGPMAKADLRGTQCAIYVEKLTRDLSKRQP